MVHSSLYAYSPSALSPNSSTTYYMPVSGAIKLYVTESNVQAVTRTAGTLTRLAAEFNSSVTTCTLRSRVATANGGMSVSASGTGFFVDTTNHDSLSNGNEINTNIVTPSSGAVMPISMGMAYAASSGASLLSVASALLSGQGIGGSGTQYLNCTGDIISFSNTDGVPESRYTQAGTAKNAFANISANNSASAPTFALRKNATTTLAVSVSITGNTTGQFEDTTHTDSVSANDLLYFKKSGGSGGSTVTIMSNGFWLDYTSGTKSDLLSATTNSDQYTASTSNRFLPIAGSPTNSGNTEANQVQLNIGFACTWSNLRIRFSTNTLGATATLSSRVGAAAGAQSTSITAGVTGSYEDTTNSESLSQGNLIDCMIVGGSGTGTATIAEVTSILNDTSGTIYTDSVTEALSLADTNTGTATFVSGMSRTEALSLTDANSAAGALAGSVAEALSLTDTPSAIATFVSGMGATEALSLTDSQNALASDEDTESEALGLTDAPSAIATFKSGMSVPEALGLTDTNSAAALYPTSRSETLGLADTCSCIVVFAVSVSEALGLTDVESGTKIAEDSHNVIVIHMHPIG